MFSKLFRFLKYPPATTAAGSYSLYINDVKDMEALRHLYETSLKPLLVPYCPVLNKPDKHD